MSASNRISVESLARLSWLASAALLLGVGIGLIWWPSARRIDELQEHARVMYERANRNQAIVERSVALRRIRLRVERDVRRLSGRSSLAAATAATIALVNGEARRFNVSIRQIAPDQVSTAESDLKEQLAPYALEIGLRGRFSDMLALVSDLPRHEVLIGVAQVDLTSLARPSSDRPELDATLHATIYRVRPTYSAEVSDATGTL